MLVTAENIDGTTDGKHMWFDTNTVEGTTELVHEFSLNHQTFELEPMIEMGEKKDLTMTVDASAGAVWKFYDNGLAGTNIFNYSSNGTFITLEPTSNAQEYVSVGWPTSSVGWRDVNALTAPLTFANGDVMHVYVH